MKIIDTQHKNTTKVLCADMSLHYIHYLSCIISRWWSDSIQNTELRPVKVIINCVSTHGL